MIRLIGLALLASLAACRPNLLGDIDRVRAEIEALERQQAPPQDAPLWITKADVANNPALREEDIFDKAIQDHTPSIPDFVYFHIMGKLDRMTDDETAKLSGGDFPLEAALLDPAPFRGRVYRIVGSPAPAPATLRHEKFADDAPIREAFSGALFTDQSRAVLFHVLKKPDVIYPQHDTIEFHGVFVKIISVGPPEKRVSAPLFLVRSLRKFM